MRFFTTGGPVNCADHCCLLPLTIANPIYQEVVPRELTYGTQLTIAEQPPGISAGATNLHTL